jgi:hypothetical protein
MKETVAATRVLFSDAAPEYYGEFMDFDPVWLVSKSLHIPAMVFGAMAPWA